MLAWAPSRVGLVLQYLQEFGSLSPKIITRFFIINWKVWFNKLRIHTYWRIIYRINMTHRLTFFNLTSLLIWYSITRVRIKKNSILEQNSYWTLWQSQVLLFHPQFISTRNNASIHVSQFVVPKSKF